MIAEFKPSGALKIHSTMHNGNKLFERDYNIPFREKITQHIENRVAIAAIDTSVKMV